MGSREKSCRCYSKAKKEIENLKIEAEQAERNGDFGTVAEIRYGKLKQLEEKINK
jgi:ATP-dependent Clp protease ATP-binding subunit ClpB